MLEELRFMEEKPYPMRHTLKQYKELLSLSKSYFITLPPDLNLKSSRTLKNQINQILYSFVLTHPNISFHLRFDEDQPIIFERITQKKDQLIQSRTQQVINHLRSLKTKRSLIESTFSYDSHELRLFICPEASKGGQKNQYIFVNNRLIEDKKIKAIIQRKMTNKYWQISCSGDYFLFIHVPANLIDPNVHPSKTIVKFVFPEIIESGVTQLIDTLPIEDKKIDIPLPINKKSVSSWNSSNEFDVEVKPQTSKNKNSPTYKTFNSDKSISQRSNRLFIANFEK